MDLSRALSAAFGWFLLTLALVGCGSRASWTTVHVPSSYRPPHTVTLKVSGLPAGDEALTLEMALIDELAKHDIHAIALDDANSRPTLRVVVEKWDPGSEGTRRFLSAFGLGGLAEGEVVVDVETLSEKGEPAIQGKAQSSVDNTADDALRAVAELIASMVATGSASSMSPAKGPHTGYP